MNETTTSEKWEVGQPIQLHHARRALEIIDAGLSNGLGEPKPGFMCIEASICYALGLPHGDDPKCVSGAVRQFKIVLNDCNWSSNAARAKGLRKLGIAQLGSKDIDENKFSKELAILVCRRVLPSMLRLVAEVVPEIHKVKLLEKALDCEKVETLGAASKASDAASGAASYAARAASGAASYAASCAASCAASYASRAASGAARAASGAASYAARAASGAASYAARAASDRILELTAECGVEALRRCKSPGIELMDQLIPSK